MSDEYDFIIKNALIVDGTGSVPFKGGVAVSGEKIVALGEVKDDANVVLDAKGHIVSPGFIDVHNHVDLSILYYPKAESFVRQGITSFVGGHCGDSTGPYNEFIGEPWFYSDLYQDVRPTMGRGDWLVPKDAFNEKHRELYGWEVDWDTMAGYFKRVEETGHSPNMVSLVGHGDIRSYVMGTDYKRYATKKEIREMRNLVDQAMQDGCRGLSVGRTYEPGRWANFEEILACAKVAAKYDGIYNSHCMRSEPRGDKKPEEARENPVYGVLEAIDIGRKAKMSVQISHLGNQFNVTPPDNEIMTEAAVKATLKVIDDANEEGLDVNFDVIPHHQTGGIFVSPYLVGAFSKWLKIAGNPEQLVKALEMEDLRDGIKEYINEGKTFAINPKSTPNWAEKRIVRVCKEPKFVDKNIAKIAEELEMEPIDAVFEVIKADPMTKVHSFRTEDDRVKLDYFQHPRMMVGCDTFAVDEKTQNRHPTWMLPNQNAFGGFAFYLRRMVREEKRLTLEEAVRKVTSQPAKKFKMTDRGVLKPGAYADIAVWNPETISDRGDQIEPRRYPDGFDYVLINGTMVFDGKEHTGALPGKVLYRE